MPTHAPLDPRRSRAFVLVAGLVWTGAIAVLAGGCRSGETAGPFAHEHRVVPVEPDVGLVASGFRAWPSRPVELRSETGVVECVASFNADIADGAGLVAEVAVGRDDWTRSAWMRLASWGAVPGAWPEEVSGADGRVAIDELILDQPAPSVWLRTVAFGEAGDVRIRRFDAVLTSDDPERVIEPAPGPRIEWPVPFIANAETDPERRSRLCSPTSLNMLLNFWTEEAEHADVVETAYSERFDLFGVWPRAIQTAWVFGVPGRLMRFADWREVRDHLARVGPLAISITARRGEVRGMPYESDSGHIIVLVGLTEEGDAIVIDPALRDEDEARRVYRAEDLTDVWVRRKRGTAYALFPPGGSALVVTTKGH